MNYYQKHLGDYAKKTGHLTPLEHGVYNLLMDGYYDREQGPTLVEASRWARARTEEEKSAVLAILDEFFQLGPDGRYTQSRVEAELADYHVRAEVNRGIAVERERRKRERKEHEESTNRAPENAGSSTTDSKTVNLANSQEPIANSHKPEDQKQSAGAPKYSPKADLLACGVEEQVATDWLSIRKAKKAPATQTALDTIKSEAAKAGMSLDDTLRVCCSRGWQGFKAEWVAPAAARAGPGPGRPAGSVYDQTMAAAERAKQKLFGATAKPGETHDAG